MQRLFGLISVLVICLVVTIGCGPKKEEHKSMFSKVLTEDIKIGTGLEAMDGDRVYVEYIGTLAKGGAQFDTNNPELSEKSKNPFTFGMAPGGGAIVGMYEGVKGMKVGGQRKISVPWNKGYDQYGNEGIPPYADLIFDVKLLYVLKKGEENTIEIDDLRPGTGAELKVGDTAEVNYKGMFVNNRVFDDTYDRKQTVKFTLGKKQAITGIDRGVEGMRVGGKRRLTLGPDAGWGLGGNATIPGNSVLIYDLELVSIKPAGSQ